MKTMLSILAAGALALSATNAMAQAPSSGASKPGSAVNTDKEVPAQRGVQGKTGAANEAKGGTKSKMTTGSGMSDKGKSNPNPTQNKNPDKETQTNKQK